MAMSLIRARLEILMIGRLGKSPLAVSGLGAKARKIDSVAAGFNDMPPTN